VLLGAVIHHLAAYSPTYHELPIKQNVAYRAIKHNLSKWPLYA
jgi:hypothetical protein